MKSIRLLLALAMAGFLVTSLVSAGEAKKEGYQAKCCMKAEKAGGKCTHECCAATAKEGSNCEKCGGKNDTQAKCCMKAEKAGGKCTHECCIAAAKEGKDCEKCGAKKSGV